MENSGTGNKVNIKILVKLITIVFCFTILSVNAVEKQELVVKKVTKHIWSIVGPLTNRTKKTWAIMRPSVSW